jgi:arylformamidase
MKMHDITRPLFNNDLVYPGDIPPSFHQEEHGSYRMSELHLSSHSGTHVDAPAHYLKSGQAVDAIPLTSLIGTCRVVDVQDAGSMITASCLAGKDKIPGAGRVVLKTAFSGNDRFFPDYPYLTPDAAELLTGHGVRCIGIDSPSVEAYSSDGSVHRHLLEHGCIIIELLDLSGVEEGEYTMVALGDADQRCENAGSRQVDGSSRLYRRPSALVSGTAHVHSNVAVRHVDSGHAGGNGRRVCEEDRQRSSASGDLARPGPAGAGLAGRA